MIKKILVPVDGSAFAEAALPMALRFAEEAGAEIRLAMVSEPLNLPPGMWAEAFLANHADYLERAEGIVSERAPDGVAVSSVLLEGEVPGALCAEVAASGADLVVMSTHGHGGLTRIWLGSVADAVLGESPVPVLLVRPEESEDGEAVASSDVRRVVVPLDGSDFAEAAIAPALEVARLFDAGVTLLRAVAYPVMISSYLPDTASANDQFIRQAEAEAVDYLDLVRARHATAGVPMELEVSVSARPAKTVLEQVEDGDAAIIVMASHARHGVARTLLGSVGDKVVRGAKSPVLIVHPSEQSLSLSAEEVA